MRKSHAGTDWHSTLAIFVSALLLRVLVCLRFAREPVWDGHYYHFAAQRIADGFGYSDDLRIGDQLVWHPWCHYPVGYSGFLGLIYRAFGSGLLVAPVVNAVLGAGLAAITHRFALLGLTKFRARVAGTLVAVSPGLIAYSPLVMSEILSAFGIMLAGVLFLRGQERKANSIGGAIGSGIMLGLTTLVRPQTILMAPLLPLSSAANKFSKRIAVGAIATIMGILTVLPWTLRNCRVMDGCAFVSTNGGWNLAIGALPRATGRFETLRASDGCPVVTGQVQQDRCWMQAGLRWIKEDPIRWISLIPRKLSHTFDHESFAINYLAEADPETWPPATREVGRGILTFSHRLLLSLGLLGLFRRSSPPRLRDKARNFASAAIALGALAFAWTGATNSYYVVAIAIPMVGLLRKSAREPMTMFAINVLATVVITHAIFFGEDRYHMVATASLCVLAASIGRRD